MNDPGQAANFFFAPVFARGLRIALVATIAYFVIRHLVWTPLHTPANDFAVYFAHAIAARNGINPYDGPNPADFPPNYVYPLFCMTVLVPLTLLPRDYAELLWLLVNVASVLAGAIAAAVVAQRRAPPESAVRRLGVAPLTGAAMVLCFLPVTETIRLGQINVFVTLLIVAAGCLGGARRRGAGGVAFALAVLLKAQPLTLAPALAPALGLRGLATTAAVGAAYLAGLFATGLWRWEWYNWTVKAPYWAHQPGEFFISFFCFLTREHGVGMDPALAARVALALELALATLLIAGVIMLWQRGAGWEWMLSWGIVCALPMSRFLEVHHLAQLCVPLVLLASAESDSSRRAAHQAMRRLEPLACAVVSLALINLGYARGDLLKGVTSEPLYYAGIAVCGWGVMRIGLRGMDAMESMGGVEKAEAGFTPPQALRRRRP